MQCQHYTSKRESRTLKATVGTHKCCHLQFVGPLLFVRFAYLSGLLLLLDAPPGLFCLFVKLGGTRPSFPTGGMVSGANVGAQMHEQVLSEAVAHPNRLAVLGTGQDFHCFGCSTSSLRTYYVLKASLSSARRTRCVSSGSCACSAP